MILSLKFAKGTKRITQKWRQLWQVVVFRCSVPLVIFKGFYSIYRTGAACTWCQFACFKKYNKLQIFQIMYIAPCVKSRRMSQILVFNNASALIEVMQNVSTLQEFTACCLSRLDGRYTMTFNCYLKKEIKNVLLSATAV